MKPYFGMPTSPTWYALREFGRLGFDSPPIQEDRVLASLPFPVAFYSSQEFSQKGLKLGQSKERRRGRRQPYLPGLEPDREMTERQEGRKFRIPPGLLWKVNGAAYPTLWLLCEQPRERMRLVIGHEGGHYYLPGHEAVWAVSIKEGRDYIHYAFVDPKIEQPYERQAYRFSTDLFLPPPWFLEDMVSLPFGMGSVIKLARRYIFPLESTAQQYVRLADRPCAFMVVRNYPPFQKENRELRVDYCIARHRFRHVVLRGTRVAEKSIIAHASSSGEDLRGEVSGDELGLHNHIRLIADCHPWGSTGDVLVLLTPPYAKQGRLF